MRRIALALPTLVAALVAAAPASATTFCVPDFHPACPNNGTNVKQTNLQTALSANGSDGQPDKVIIGSLLYTATGSIEATGTDGLEVVGAGPADTVLTTSSAGNIYVFDISFRGQPQSIRDLRIVIPSSFPDAGGNGAAAQITKGTVENVEIESRNPDSTGMYFNGGGVMRDSLVHGTTGTLNIGVAPNDTAAGALTIERSTVEAEGGSAILGQSAVNPITLRRDRLSGSTPIELSIGQSATVSDSLLTATGPGISVQGGLTTASSLAARNVTLVGLPGNTSDALTVQAILAPGSGNASISMSDSIVRGFAHTWNRQAAVSNVLEGNANISLDHSNFTPGGLSIGDGLVTQGAGNIDADPLFAGPADYRLSAGSPSLDAGDPTVAISGDGLDLGGLPREVNATGKAQTIRDQGAFEFQVPPPPSAGGATTPGPTAPSGPTPAVADTARPTITGLKLAGALTQRKGGRVKLTLSEPATVTLTFTRRPAGGKAKPRKVRVTFKNRRAGANTLRVKAGRLPAGRWTLSAVAVDAAGNRSKAVTRPIRAAR